MKILFFLINTIILTNFKNILAEQAEAQNTENKNSKNITNFYNQTNVKNDDKACETHVQKVIQYIKNSTDPNRFYAIYPFIVYSSLAINDFGDYSSCVKDPNWNYNLITYQTSIGNVSIALCFYKECTADYFNGEKKTIVELLNTKYNLNITEKAILFSNPRKNYLRNLYYSFVCT